MAIASASIHASAVLVGARAALIRGPSASGKSRLALQLIQAAEAGLLPFAKLVGDDRVHVDAAGGRLLAAPAEPLAGLLELRGMGLLRLDYEPRAVVGLVIDLAAPDAVRLPDEAQRKTDIRGIVLPRLAVAPSVPPLPGVLAALKSGLEPWL
jgi:HPr kinase/phosphorylase